VSPVVRVALPHWKSTAPANGDHLFAALERV